MTYAKKMGVAVGGILCFCYWRKKQEKKSVHKYTYQSPSTFLFSAEFVKVLPWMHLYLGIFALPHLHRGAALTAGRGVEGNASVSCLLPLLALVHLQSHWGGWRISWSSLLLPALVPASSKRFPYPEFLSVSSLSLHTPLHISDLGGEGSTRFGEWKPYGWEQVGRVGPRRWKALHGVEVCKRTRQCQLVFAQVASSSHCLWSCFIWDWELNRAARVGSVEI